MLTIIYSYYNNPGMLAAQYNIWRDYPSGVELLVIDDGSRQAAIDVPRVAGATPVIYRITEDKPWNQDAARNLGAHRAAGEWLLLLDIDHAISAEVLAQLLAQLPQLERGTAYRLTRRLYSGKALAVAPNIWLMRRDDFWRVGGYDERLCGSYGTDRDFVRRVAQQLCIETLDCELSVYTSAAIADAATRGLDRTVQPIPELDENLLTLASPWVRQL